MLTFFRRIRRNLANQNKFVQYSRYAIGEILLVVFGILIALQVNNWNENQLNKKKEIEILVGVKGELNNLIERMDLWAQFNRTGERLTSEVLQYKRTDANKQTMDSLFSSMPFVNVFDKGGSLMETLIIDGKLELIRDKSIRKNLMRWPDMLEDIHTNDLSIRDFVWREIIPYLANFGIPEFSCESLQFYCYQDKPISDTYLNLLENDQFKSLLRFRHTAFQFGASDFQTKANEAKIALNLIDDYLSKNSN